MRIFSVVLLLCFSCSAVSGGMTVSSSPLLTYARLGSDSTGTVIPTGNAYNTKLLFQTVVYDTRGDIADLANSRLIIPPGFRYVKISGIVAWFPNTVGYRACRIYRGRGAVPKSENMGNIRMLPVAGQTTNVSPSTGWLKIDGTLIAAGDYFAMYPAQDSGADLSAGTDIASTWMEMELREN